MGIYYGNRHHYQMLPNQIPPDHLKVRHLSISVSLHIHFKGTGYTNLSFPVTLWSSQWLYQHWHEAALTFYTQMLFANREDVYRGRGVSRHKFQKYNSQLITENLPSCNISVLSSQVFPCQDGSSIGVSYFSVLGTPACFSVIHTSLLKCYAVLECYALLADWLAIVSINAVPC